MFERIITDDEAEWAILKLAHETSHKFAIEMGPIPIDERQFAFERGIDNDWFTLVDVGPIASAGPGVIMKIFKLTAAGQRRRDKLARLFN